MKSLFITAASVLFSIGFPGSLAADEKPAYDYAEESAFWSFQVPTKHDLPAVKDQDWGKKRIDAFVLGQLESLKLAPNLEAPRRQLFRRISFDLVGLPPQAEAIADQKVPFETYVDQLLESPHFGERWARMWLDVVRYAEDQAHIVGNNNALTYPNAYLYRDWVISAFNRDIPYEEFLRLQLAADLVETRVEEDQAALGLMGLGPKYYRRGDLAVMADEWEDRIDTLTRGVLGLTVACARCHDHFFDPIPTADYYALAGVFASSDMFNRPMTDDCEMAKDGQTKKPDDAAHVLREASKMQDVPVFNRGDISSKGDPVPRGFLTILGGGQRLEFNRENSGRLDLANAIVSRDNPLTARVWVNRVWSELIGAPLVATKSNFGNLGEKPTHPELLDDLAARFMDEGGWSLKWLIREIVLSSTYRQSSARLPEKIGTDPANQFLSRMNRRRLSVEMWRDSLFSVSGELDGTLGGKSFQVSDPTANRRAVYAEISRLQLDPMLALFDFPDPNLHSAGRSETTTPLQKLFVMNHPLIVKQSEVTAERIAKLAGEGADSVALIDSAYQLLFCRKPADEEVSIGGGYLREGGVFSDYVQALIASNEFAWLD